jgi:hypothetical protein
MVRCNAKAFGKGNAALFGAVGLATLGSMAQAQTSVKTATLPPQVSQQLTQVAQAGIPAGTTSYAELLAVNAARRQETVDIGGRRYPFAIRLGAMVSPRVKFVGGADLTFPGYGWGPNWVGRIDAEAIVSGNLGGNSTLVPVTFDQVYFSPTKTGPFRLYAGLGIGPYFGDATRFGGKFFVGTRFSQTISGEASLHFSGDGDPLFILQARTTL